MVSLGAPPQMKAWVLASCLLAVPWVGAQEPAADRTADRAADQATVERQLLPALAARQQVAETIVDHGERYFAGGTADEDWGTAFPDLAAATLVDPSFVRAELHLLQEGALARAAECTAEPAAQDDNLRERLRQQLERTCVAEARADELRRKFLLAVLAGVERHSAWRGDRLEAWHRRLRGYEYVEDAAASAASQTRLARRAAAAGQARAWLERYHRAVIVRFSVVRSELLAELASQDLSVVRSNSKHLEALPHSETPDDDSLGNAERRRRLALAVPLLPGQLASDVRAELLRSETAELQRLRLAVAERQPPSIKPATPTSDLETRLKALRREREQLTAQGRQRQVEARSWQAPEELDELRQQVWDERLTELEQRTEAIRAALERARRLAASGLDPQAATLSTQVQTAAAEERARESQTLAQGGDPERQRLASLRQDILSLLEVETRRHDDLLDAIEQLRLSLEEHITKARLALALPDLDPDRPAEVDAVYAAAHGDVIAVRQSSQELFEQQRQLRADRQSRLDGVAKVAAVSPSLRADWANARGDLRQALERRQGNLTAEADALLGLLAEAKRARRQLRPLASAAARSEVQHSFLEELRGEWREIPEILSWRARRWRAQWQGWPQQLLDLPTLRSWLSQASMLLLVLVPWFYGRRLAPDGLLKWLDSTRRQRRRRGPDAALDAWQEPEDFGDLAVAGRPAVVAALDVTAAAVLYFMSRHSLPVVAMFAVLWLAIRGIALARQLALLTTSRSSPVDNDIAAATGIAAARESLAVSTGGWLAGTVFVLWGWRHIGLGWLDADRLTSVGSVLLSMVALVIVMILLHRWSPFLQQRMERDFSSSRWAEHLLHSGGWWAIPRSGAILVLLLIDGLWRFSARTVDQGLLSRIGAAMDQRELDKAEWLDTPLSDQQRQQILATEGTWSHRQQELDALEAAFDRWLSSGRRGLVSIIGEQGEGKSRFLDQAAQKLPQQPGAEALQVIHMKLDQRLPEAAALHWLASEMGLDTEVGSASDSDVDARLEEHLLRQLETLPAALVLVDDLHLLLLRAVGGLASLRAVFSLMAASSHRHFWLVAFHGPAWSYLEGLAVGVYLDRFRARIQLGSFMATELADWLQQRTEAAGFEVDFGALMRRAPWQRDRQRLLTRATAAYWRLLADASTGNPGVALELWLRGLCRARSDTELAVTLFKMPDPQSLEKLSDAELFVLTAIVIHGALDETELAEVLNLSSSQVRATYRHLTDLDLLTHTKSGGLVISMAWRPSVHRLLRRRHLLHHHQVE